MVTTCCALNCSARYRKGANRKFHYFPRNELLKKLWISALRKKKFTPSKASRICSDHFRNEDYFLNVHGHYTLRRSAIPSCFDFSLPGLNICGEDDVTPTNSDIPSTSQEGPSTSQEPSTSRGVPLILEEVPSCSTEMPEPIVAETICTEGELNEDTAPEITRKRKRTVPTYFGDFVESHLKDEVNRHLYWKVSQKTVKTLRLSNGRLRIAQIRQKKKITKLDSLLENLIQQRQISSETAAVLKECIPEAEKQILSRQLRGRKGKFPPALRAFALTLNFYSASAYNYVRRTFGKHALPHPKSLSKWCSSIDGSPGYTVEAIRAIKMKVDIEKSNGKSLIAGLMMDEMSIREHVEWTGSRHVGYINFGTGINDTDSLPRAKNAIVFMLVALNARWKVPIAYFLIDSLTAEAKANLVKGCLLQMRSTGVIIKSLTFDGITSNLSMANLLGANLSWPNIRPYFLHPETEEKIHILLDACHMMKLCRNTLGDWGSFYDGQGALIKWSYFEELVKLQNESGLHAATKIRNRHLEYQKEKMKVKLAVQTFSSSVADAISYCCEDLNIPQFQGSGALVDFCRNMNSIFDVLNSRNFLSRVIEKKPLCLENAEFIQALIKRSVQYLSTLADRNKQLIICSGRKTGFIGLIICLISIKNLFEELIIQKRMKFLCTYKLSQDHLEMFFSVMRSRGGFNNNPTARQFEAAYKRVLIHTELTSPDSANCLAQDDTSILNVGSTSSVPNGNALDSLNVEDISFDESIQMEVLSDISNRMYLTDVVEYIAGFVSRRTVKLINCDICARTLTSSSTTSALLLRKNRGGLCKPSADVVKICTVAESILRTISNFSNNNIINRLIMVGIRKLNLSELFPAINDHCFDQDPLDTHLLQLVKLILKTYFTVRLHHINNAANEISIRMRSRLTKLIHFKNQ